MTGIGTLQENSLHAALKVWYTQPGDQLETVVDGFVIDLVRGNLLVEVQTANFSAIKRKLMRLIETHPVRLVYPIPYEKWILRMAADGVTPLGRRKSPKRGQVEDIFHELVRFPQLIQHINFTLEVLLIREEVIWLEDGRGSWRRKGRSIADRRLLEIVSRNLFTGPDDFLRLIPSNLPQVFTVRELARDSGQPRYLARKMAYCLREMGVIELSGKRGRAFAYFIKSQEKVKSEGLCFIEGYLVGWASGEVIGQALPNAG
jgi:hypothetical protein